MADRVGVHPEPGLSLGRKPPATQRQDLPLRGVDIIDADVQMQLLGVFGIWPPRWNPPSRPLERELSGTRFEPDDYPVVAVLIDPHAQKPRVERRERPGIGAVQDRLLQFSDHASILYRSRPRRVGFLAVVAIVL